MTQRGPQFQGPLFHGTASSIPVGDRIVSAKRGGQVSHWDDAGDHLGQPSRDHAFATSSEQTAWHFARHASSQLPSTWGSARARVYEVAPNPRMKPGVHTELKEYIAPSFKTTGVHDIMPGQQGTFPQINWKRHLPKDSYGQEPNHPITNPGHLLSHGEQIAQHNDRVEEAQENAHVKFKARIESIGQTALFDYDHKTTKHSDYKRAQAHDMRHVVNEGLAPAHAVDHELANDESMDAFNRRRGRRTNFARRDRGYTGPESWKEY